MSHMQNQGNQNQSPYQIAAQGYNPQQNLEIAAEMGQKTPGEISRILATKSVTGIEFGYMGKQQNNAENGIQNKQGNLNNNFTGLQNQQ